MRRQIDLDMAGAGVDREPAAAFGEVGDTNELFLPYPLKADTGALVETEGLRQAILKENFPAGTNP